MVELGQGFGMNATKIVWLLGSGAGLALLGAFGFNSWTENNFANLEARGQFGDSFGAFNAVVGALGFGAVGYSLYHQQKQISKNETDQKEQVSRADAQILAMNEQAQAMIKLASAMSEDGKVNLLVSTAEAVERRIEQLYGEIPDFYLYHTDIDKWRRKSFAELDVEAKNAEARYKEIAVLKGYSVPVPNPATETYRHVMTELRVQRARRKGLFLKITSEMEHRIKTEG